MYLISTFDLNSDGYSHTDIKLYDSYDDALTDYTNYVLERIIPDEQYGTTIKKIFNSKLEEEEYYREPDFDYTKQYTIYISYVHNDIIYYKCYQDGSWKRPCGIELTCIDMLTETKIMSYPKNRTY